nr:hypothetical protein GCM10017745_53520 [Saccharothrix mutabilis subsp. capreolus]
MNPSSAFAGTRTGPVASATPCRSCHAATSGGTRRDRIARTRAGSTSSVCALCPTTRPDTSSTDTPRPSARDSSSNSSCTRQM